MGKTHCLASLATRRPDCGVNKALAMQSRIAAMQSASHGPYAPLVPPLRSPDSLKEQFGSVYAPLPWVLVFCLPSPSLVNFFLRRQAKSAVHRVRGHTTSDNPALSVSGERQGNGRGASGPRKAASGRAMSRTHSSRSSHAPAACLPGTALAIATIMPPRAAGRPRPQNPTFADRPDLLGILKLIFAFCSSLAII